MASRPLVFIGLLAAVAAPLMACEPPPPRSALTYTEDARRAYEAAVVELTDHNWLEAQALLREVKRKYAYSRYAKLAELRLADADFEQDKFAEAARGYRQFVHDHRSDQAEVVYARARIAEAEYRQISESLLLPSADERDQGVVMDAYREVKSFINDYPDAKESTKIKELLADVTARLIRHELYVARFYLNRGNFEAAVGRIRYALHNFGAGADDNEPEASEAEAPVNQVEGRGGSARSTKVTPRPPSRSRPPPRPRRAPTVADDAVSTGLEPEALLLLGQTYLRMKKPEEAKEAFDTLLRDYPRSPLVSQARNYLDFMRAPPG